MPKVSRGGEISKRLREDLVHVTRSWFRPPDQPERNGDDQPPVAPPEHTYSHVNNSGEMNHMGHFRCEFCDGEMRISTFTIYKTPPAGVPDLKVPLADDHRWECSRCGRIDETSFRICTKCGRKTVPDKWAASAREMPVSLNAGGCTDCERCAICDGILAIGNIMWYHGRWTHAYPSPEFDSRSGEQIVVTRERSKFYAFHTHQSCHMKNPNAVEQIIIQRTPEWYKQGEAEQERAASEQLRLEGRCIICRNKLTWWDKVFERDTHKECEPKEL